MKEKTRYILGTALLLAAVLMIAVGVYSGESNVVLAKAVNICLACIGIS